MWAVVRNEQEWQNFIAQIRATIAVGSAAPATIPDPARQYPCLVDWTVATPDRVIIVVVNPGDAQLLPAPPLTQTRHDTLRQILTTHAHNRQAVAAGIMTSGEAAYMLQRIMDDAIRSHLHLSGPSPELGVEGSKVTTEAEMPDRLQWLQFMKDVAAAQLTIVHYLVQTRICRDAQFEDTYSMFRDKVEQWHQDDAAAARQGLDPAVASLGDRLTGRATEEP